MIDLLKLYEELNKLDPETYETVKDNINQIVEFAIETLLNNIHNRLSPEQQIVFWLGQISTLVTIRNMLRGRVKLEEGE